MPVINRAMFQDLTPFSRALLLIGLPLKGLTLTHTHVRTYKRDIWAEKDHRAQVLISASICSEQQSASPKDTIQKQNLLEVVLYMKYRKGKEVTLLRAWHVLDSIFCVAFCFSTVKIFCSLGV